MRYLRPLVAAVCFAFAGSHFARAQSGFIKGYYVTDSRDTVQGFIDYRSDIRNFGSCVFKTSPDATSQTLYPIDIFSYTIDDKATYTRYRYKPKEGDELIGFFKVLVRGKLSLLTYDNRFFALSGEDAIIEVTRVRVDVSGRLVENRNGIGNLKILMADCEKTNEEYLRRQYRDGNLQRIFLEYNRCVNASTHVFENPSVGTKVALGVQVLPSLAISHAGSPMDKNTMSTDGAISFGVVAAIHNDQLFENFDLMVEANYYQYSGYGYFHSIDDGVETNNDLFEKYKAIQIPLFLRIGQRYFLDVGIQNQLVVKQDLRWRVETITGSEIKTSSNDVDKINPYSASLLIGGGMKINVASFPVKVFARYSRSSHSFFSGKPAFQLAQIGFSVQLTKDQK